MLINGVCHLFHITSYPSSLKKKRCWRAGFPENYDLFGKFGSSPKLFMNEKTQLPLLGIVKRPTPLKSNTDTKNGHILKGATFSKPSPRLLVSATTARPYFFGGIRIS